MWQNKGLVSVRRVALATALLCVHAEAVAVAVTAQAAAVAKANLVRRESPSSTAAATSDSKVEILEARAEKAEQRLAELEEAVGSIASASHEDGSRVPKLRHEDGSERNLTLWERLRYLERKVDGATNWVKDPALFEETQYDCKNMSTLGTDHHVCFDGFEAARARHHKATKSSPRCVVYDLGIRANPEFGVNMMKDYGCDVRAYDPSPISVEWWHNDANKTIGPLKDMYKFRPVGAGGEDGVVNLYDADWSQVSIVKAENDYTKRPKGTPDVALRTFSLPVETFSTMMQENGDSYIDVMKIDIEGSEYLFLQDIFDRMGCPPVGQLTIEWHNFGLDGRYGSSPELNTMHNMLNSCGYKAFYNREHWRVEGQKMGVRVLPPMRITLSSFCKECLVEDHTDEDHIDDPTDTS